MRCLRTSWRLAAFGLLCVGLQTVARAADAIRPTIEVSAAQAKSLGITTAQARGASDFQLANLPALVLPPVNARIAVAATFPGTVLQVMALEGQTVRKGQVLAVIASHEIVEKASELAQARSRLAAAGSAAERLKLLSEEGIIAGSRAEEARALHEQALADVAAKSRVLQTVHADGAQGTYSLVAPIDGIVSASNIQTGEPLVGMSAPYVIDSGSAFEVQAQIPERLIGKITEGMRLRLPGGIEARVTSAGSVMQPETRSALLKAQLAPGSKVIAGMSTSAAVFAQAPAGAVRLPRSALTMLAGEQTVFVATVGGYAPRAIVTASSVGEEVVVISGVNQGETVATAGLSELKSMALSR